MREVGLSRPALLFTALASYGLSTVVSRGPTIALVALGTLSLWASLTSPGHEGHIDLGRWIVATVALFAILSAIGPRNDLIGNERDWLFLISGIIWIAAGLAWFATRSNLRARRALYTFVLVATAAIGVGHVVAAAGVGFDVWLLHEQAADAIASGVSPYSSAVTVPNGAPGGGPPIVGYPYPPVTAVSYSLGSWLGGDARWVSLVCWLAALAVIGVRSVKADGGGRPLGAMIVAASIPAWPLVLTSGWTESLSLALLALAVTVWGRPRASGGLLGLFLGSKQYLVAGAPLMLTERSQAKWTRGLWALIGMTIAYVPVLLWGVADFVSAAVEFHFETPARPDGSSIVGLLDMFGVAWEPPVWLMAAAVLGVAYLVGRRVNDLTAWLSAFAVLLSVALFLSSQAATNYWFLMAGISALALAFVGSRSDPSRMQTPAVATTPEQATDQPLGFR